MTNEYRIAVLLPTRGRTVALSRSVESLVNLAKDTDSIQIMLGFDNDDPVGIDHFKSVLQPWLDERNLHYTAMTFAPMGYIRLNEYVNTLAEKSSADWLVFWNDDAVMETQDWDVEIMKWEGQFKLLAFQTHNLHPYSIFPIVPRKWLDLLGYLSPHQISDAWLSQQAYMLDILERIPVEVLHDRHDLTGNNKDETFLNRPMLEGNPMDPDDFHSLHQSDIRLKDSVKVANYLQNECKIDMKFFNNILIGVQDPWEKLKLNDVNNQMVQFTHPTAKTYVTK
jgi:hypothetical protein